MKTDSRLRTGSRRFMLAAVGVTWLALAGYSAAQITAPTGSQPQDKRTGDANASGPVQEGGAPQSKDSKSSARPHQNDKQKSGGATGFDNGLYGTGAGRQ
jgi:hypothetical protein